MLSRRAKFDRDYPFEVLWQQCKGRGNIVWTKPKVNKTLVLHLRQALKTKLRRLLATMDAEDQMREYGYETMEPSALETTALSSNLNLTGRSASLSILIPAASKPDRPYSNTSYTHREKASISLFLQGKSS